MYRNILVPVDDSPTSHRGLDEAIKLAKLAGGKLRLLHVVDEMPYVMRIEEGYGALLSDALQALRNRGEDLLAKARLKAEQEAVEVDTVVLDSACARLADHVMDQVKEWGADLVVLGTHGRRGVNR